ncbi:DUF3782 domain-containing protein [Geminocystis sp. CENA526]|uniref:DUF3782 domain-containing protein n=1 Tax=Geminocystis sp. CENA526 TaxID=1355871 RepID=UPI003D6DBD91
MATTADEVWKLLGELIESQKETDRKFQETDRRMKETDRRMKETDRRMKETDRQMKETDRQMKETDRQMKETDKKIKELGKQIGGLAGKFGSFTEGLALPSMEKILREKFAMEVISPSVRVTKQGEHIEIDVLAYANDAVNAVYVVEVKSHAREDSIDQLKTILQRFRHFFPEHQNKQVYGILAAVDLSAYVRQKILQEGLYVARINDDVFNLDIPEDFQPKVW